MKKVQKGFTLVELIVVITILAILGTIAFISLQGYSQDARDSKVTSDTRSIASVIETKLTEGNSVHDFVGSADANNQVAAAQGLTGTFASGVTMGSGTYNVGGLDFLELGQSSADFTDANGDDIYKIGTFTTTEDSESYVMYQVAGIKGGVDAPVGVVKGNYIYVDGTDTEGLVSASGGSLPLEDGIAADASEM